VQTKVKRKRPGRRQGPDPDIWQVPRIDTHDRMATGTAAGIAREIGIDAIYVRVSFVLLAIAGGWGIVLYGIAWAVLARQTLSDTPYEPIPKGVSPSVRLLGYAMVIFGLVVLSNLFGTSPLGSLVWPAVFLGAAVAIGLDRSQLDRLKPLGEFQRHSISARLVVGLGLLFAGVVSASVVSLSFWQAIGGIAVAALVLVGAGIVFAPVVSGLASEVMAERRGRIRSEERADMAAHLHDSVLQTLALIQKRSDDAGVVSLARRQERELRTWLFDDKAMNPNLGFRAGLQRQMATVEDLYEIPIEVIVVGDCATDGDVAALLQASREAAANAARHSGAGRVDVYAEVMPSVLEVFVRDVGIGFDPDIVGSDRAGVRDSIIGRIERHGGTAAIHSSKGQGTEVELRLPRTENDSEDPDRLDPDQVETF